MEKDRKRNLMGRDRKRKIEKERYMEKDRKRNLMEKDRNRDAD